MGISVTDPLGWAQQRTAVMLFKPFNAAKWFALGFSAWLAQLLENSSLGSNFGDVFNATPGPAGGGGGGAFPPAQSSGNAFLDFVASARQFIALNLYWLLPVVLIALAISITIYWVRARGKFMFLENVALDRAAVTDPWKRLGPLANNYFFFELRLMIMAIFLGIGALSLSYLIAQPDLFSNQFSNASVAAIVVGVVLLLGIMLTYSLIKAVAQDFLIPVMYLRGSTIGPAWTEFRTRVLTGNVGSFMLFYLMRILIGIVIGFIMLAGICLTCCAAAIPYVGTVFFLPIYVFIRCYSLFFLSQFGGEYNLLADISPPPIAAFPVIMAAPPPLPSDLPPPLPPTSNSGDPS